MKKKKVEEGKNEKKNENTEIVEKEVTEEKNVNEVVQENEGIENKIEQKKEDTINNKEEPKEDTINREEQKEENSKESEKAEDKTENNDKKQEKQNNSNKKKAVFVTVKVLIIIAVLSLIICGGLTFFINKTKANTTSNLNLKAPGDYKISYNLTINYLSLNQTLYRNIHIKDTAKPELTINSEKDITVYLGDKFEFPTYKAIDNFDGDITGKVKVTDNLNLNERGEYEINYTVTDSNGNETTEKEKSIYCSFYCEPNTTIL